MFFSIWLFLFDSSQSSLSYFYSGSGGREGRREGRREGYRERNGKLKEMKA
jgi:hypothetical protein